MFFFLWQLLLMEQQYHSWLPMFVECTQLCKCVTFKDFTSFPVVQFENCSETFVCLLKDTQIKQHNNAACFQISPSVLGNKHAYINNKITLKYITDIAGLGGGKLEINSNISGIQNILNIKRHFFPLFHRAFRFTKFYLYQRMHLFLSYTKIT